MPATRLQPSLFWLPACFGVPQFWYVHLSSQCWHVPQAVRKLQLRLPQLCLCCTGGAWTGRWTPTWRPSCRIWAWPAVLRTAQVTPCAMPEVRQACGTGACASSSDAIAFACLACKGSLTHPRVLTHPSAGPQQPTTQQPDPRSASQLAAGSSAPAAALQPKGPFCSSVQPAVVDGGHWSAALPPVNFQDPDASAAKQMALAEHTPALVQQSPEFVARHLLAMVALSERRVADGCFDCDTHCLYISAQTAAFPFQPVSGSRCIGSCCIKWPADTCLSCWRRLMTLPGASEATIAACNALIVFYTVGVRTALPQLVAPALDLYITSWQAGHDMFVAKTICFFKRHSRDTPGCG